MIARYDWPLLAALCLLHLAGVGQF